MRARHADPTQLVDLLLEAVARYPDRELRLPGGQVFTNTSLLEAALAAAGGARRAGVVADARVVLVVHEQADFFPSFWGVLLAGGIPVPLAGPRGGSPEEIRRVERVVALVDGVLVVDRGVRLPGWTLEDVGDWLASDPIDAPIRRDGIGLIQFSSGSTRDPKGVCLDQRALLANARQMIDRPGLGPDDVMLNWMPQFHDMGLIAAHLVPLLAGMHQVRTDPIEVIAQPLRWLGRLSEHRATMATTTNFALSRVVAEVQRRGLPHGIDLSALRWLVNGGEPIAPEVCRAFSRLTGAPLEVHYPSYGLAEACVGLCASRSRGLRTRSVGGREVVVIGPPLDGIAIRVVDEGGAEVAPGEVGRLSFQGPNQFSGYLGEPPVTGWVDTGDLVSVVDGEVAVVGRAKDLIVVNARNLHPHDVEHVAESVDGVRPGGAVAVVDRQDDHEALSVLVRVDPDRNAVPLLREVRRRVAAELGVEPYRVGTLEHVPRTTSGKKRRAWLAERLAAGALDHEVAPGTVEAVRKQWEAQLGRSIGPSDLDTPFRELGGASLGAVELATRVEAAFGVAPDLRLLTEGSTVRHMARLLERQAPREEIREARAREPIAIVGLASRLPGGESLAGLAADGPSRLGPPPADRPGLGGRVGGYLEPQPPFEAERFRIDAAEAAVMDPQQRLVLTLAAELLPTVGGERRVGVFVGAGYQAGLEALLGRLDEPLPAGTMAANLLNLIAARVSHTFDLTGPALAVDTACSSSLVALHLAIRSLQAGECRVALAGGVSLLPTATTHRLFELAGALSPSGTCRPFDDGDGMVPAEGAGLFLLAPLGDARARGWPILGVVRGTAINNDGASLGVMAPNPAGQEAVIRAALADAGVAAEQVRFVEAHGTGTAVGDAVEAAVLRRVYPHGPARGAVKGRLGHLLCAAGVAGLAHALARLAPGELGGVSSFGFGGTNAHVLVEGAAGGAVRVAPEPTSPPPRRVPTTDGWVHAVTRDLAGGLAWTPVTGGSTPLFRGMRAVVTGGAGALGRALTTWLRERYDARVTWVGRTTPTDRPAGVGFLAADVGDPAAARDVLTRLGTVDVLFHLAGGTSPEALRAKRLGAEHLEGLADRVVLFSSISGVLPGLDRGIEAYAAANAALDDYARRQRGLGRRVTSVAWPPWEGEGLAAGRTKVLGGAGIRPIDADRAMACLEVALASDLPVVVVLDRPDVGAAPLPDDLEGWLVARVAEAAQRHPSQIALDDPLPSLGLDSVAALDLVRELEAKLGRKLPTTLAFEGGSVGGMLRILARGGVREEAGAAPVGSGPPSDGVAPGARGGEVLPAQQVFVVQSGYFPAIPGNTLLACRLDPGLDREALRRALTALAARHPAITSAIRREEGRWRRVPGAPPELRWVARVDRQALHEEPFQLATGPVLRVVCDGRELVLNAHHALSDAWSLRTILGDLLELHALAAAGAEPALPPLRTTLDEAVAAVGAVVDGDAAWWRARFAEPLPPLNLPWVDQADAPPAPPCHALPVGISADDTLALEAVSRELGATLPAVVLAAWVHALWRSSGTGDLAVRVAQARREARLPDLDRVVGSFADSLPVRVEVPPAATVRDLVPRVAAELAAVQARAGASAIGLASLQERGGAPAGLAPAGFSFPLLPAATTLGGQRVTDVFGASASGFTRIGLIAWKYDGRLQGSLNALGSHLTVAACEEIGARFLTALHELIAPPEPLATTLHGRFLAHARRHPERPAVGGLSYGQLDRRSAAVANALSGPRIAVLAAPSEVAVVAVLGVLRSGAAYVPLDPGWPDARVAQVLEVARPTALVAPAELADRAAAFGIPVVVAGAAEAEEGPDAPGAAAYVMFTSGTTGVPKGVVMSHAAALAFVDWCLAAFGLGPDDRLAQTSSLGFGGSIRQMFATLAAGGAIEPVPAGLTRDPDALVRFLRDRRITVWNSVPSLWTHLMDAMERVPDADPLPDVRWVLLGGEAVPAAHVRRWRARFGGRMRLANLYGSTETAHNATWFEVRSDPDGAHTPIGWSRAGTRAHLVDARDGVGEIVVSGGIADGYLHAPEATAAAFVDWPGLGRVYRTGDLARRRPDGALVYLGRGDSQVQVRGNRVELGEIEHVLCEFPGVRHAAVVQRPDGRLHAAYEGEADAAALRDWLAARLPAFMVPHTWEARNVLPRTAVGKADRRALAAGDAAGGGGEVGGPLIDRLAAAWVAVLGLAAPPGPDDGFFALGGDSLTLLEVVDRMRDRVAIESPLPLYRHATLRGMAAYLAGRPPVAGPAPVGELPASERASVVERGFWLAHRADPDHPPLWTASVPLRGPLDLAAFSKALALVVARHPMLRATWDDQGFRHVAPRHDPLLQLDDLSMLAAPLRERALRGRRDELAATRLPLDRPMPWAVRLCRMAADHHELLLAVHHAVADGWSAWQLTTELLEAHAAFAAGREPDLPPCEPFRPPAPGEPDPWWEQALAGLAQRPAPERPIDQEAAFSLDPGRWARLLRRAARLGLSPFAVVAAAVFRALQAVLGTDDVVVSTALAGRPAGLATSVGPYARALPVRVREPATAAVVAAALADAGAHADAPPWQVVAAAGPDGAARLGRFFLTWLDPSAVPRPTGPVVAAFRDGSYRFATRSTDTEVLVGALVDDGLHLHLHGGDRVTGVAAALEAELRALTASDAALVVYAPDEVALPVARPMVIELVDTPAATTELVLLPRRVSELAAGDDLDRAVAEAMAATRAPVVALAGQLPALTGLATRPLGRSDQRLTTGHAATVVAMVLAIDRLLGRVGRRWSELTVGFLGYGAIGRSVHELAVDRFGPPGEVRIRDPRHPDTVDRLEAELIVGATSGGRALDAAALPPGTLVVDDSFPRCFDDAVARARMEASRDVVLIGGGMLDVGTLHRWSPFPQADALRERYPSRWLPGCHAEAALLALRPELGPTVGPVDPARARRIWDAVVELGWTVPPPNLAGWVIPDDVLDGVTR